MHLVSFRHVSTPSTHSTPIVCRFLKYSFLMAKTQRRVALYREKQHASRRRAQPGEIAVRHDLPPIHLVGYKEMINLKRPVAKVMI